jgi:hypothetical protein
VTANKRVKTVEHLLILANERQSVAHPNWSRPIPAVVVMNMAASLVVRLLPKLTVYAKKERKPWPQKLSRKQS